MSLQDKMQGPCVSFRRILLGNILRKDHVCLPWRPWCSQPRTGVSPWAFRRPSVRLEPSLACPGWKPLSNPPAFVSRGLVYSHTDLPANVCIFHRPLPWAESPEAEDGSCGFCISALGTEPDSMGPWRFGGGGREGGKGWVHWALGRGDGVTCFQLAPSGRGSHEAPEV